MRARAPARVGTPRRAAEATTSASTFVRAAVERGKWLPIEHVMTDCGLYVCDSDTACVTSCTNTSDCTSTANCKKGACT